jgi:hypothetical protein
MSLMESSLESRLEYVSESGFFTNGYKSAFKEVSKMLEHSKEFSNETEILRTIYDTIVGITGKL